MFDRAPDFHVFYQFPQFECLQPGIHRRADNIVRGEWRGRSVMTFDYHFLADNNVRCEFSAVIAESHMPLKPLLIRPEKFRDRVAHSLGLRDIEFESAEFNRMFWVGSPDARWARDVLHPRAMEVLIAKPDFIIKLEARHAIAYRPMLMPVFQFRSAVELVCGLLDLLPAYLAGKDNAQG